MFQFQYSYQCPQYSLITNNLQLYDDTTLSSSTESTNAIPFANENIGTIKQRLPIDNHYNALKAQRSMDTMKRSLPIEFFQQSNIHSTTSIYDNNERFSHKIISSPRLPERRISVLKSEGAENLSCVEPCQKDMKNKLTK